jgi:hypothetical protein
VLPPVSPEPEPEPEPTESVIGGGGASVVVLVVVVVGTLATLAVPVVVGAVGSGVGTAGRTVASDWFWVRPASDLSFVAGVVLTSVLAVALEVAVRLAAAVAVVDVEGARESILGAIFAGGADGVGGGEACAALVERGSTCVATGGAGMATAGGTADSTVATTGA